MGLDKGTIRRMGWAWAGATLGGFFGEEYVAAFLASRVSIPLEAVAFFAGAVLGILVGDAVTKFSVAAGLKGIVLGTKHALAASAGGYAGLLVERNLQLSAITALPDFTVAAFGAAISVVLFEFSVIILVSATGAVVLWVWLV